MIPFKLLILGMFVVGVTVGVAVTGATGGATGGCDVFNSVVESASDDSGDAAADAGDGSNDAPGTDDGGTDDGSTDDGGRGDGSGDGGTDDGSGGGANGNSNSAANGNDNGSGNSNNNGNSNSNDNGGSNGNANDNGGDDGQSPIAGDFSATIRATAVQSVGGDPSPQPDRNMAFALGIGDDRLPENLPIINFAGAPNVVTTAVRTTDPEQTIEVQSGTQQITLRVSATEAQYGASNFRVVHAINYNGVQGNLTLRGTGTQTIVATLDAAGNLSFDAQVDYSIRYIVNNSTLVTATEAIDAVGTLARE